MSLDYSNDMPNAAKTKVELSKIASGCDDIISNGIGSKRIIAINMPTDCQLEIKNKLIDNVNINEELLAKFYLTDSGEKIIKIDTNSGENSINQILLLKKGENTLSITWKHSNNQITLKKI